MGTAGAGVFADDTTSEIRETYRRLLMSGVIEADASAAVIEHFEGELGDDERHLLWLGLSAAQFEVGRLDAEVRNRAIRIIDAGTGLDRWVEAAAGALVLRQRSLAKLRSKLTGPQPQPKALRKPWMYATDLEPGDVLSHRGATRVTVWRVARLEVDWESRVPLLQQAEWDAPTAPSEPALDELTLLPNLRLKSRPVTSWFVSKLRKGEPDWSESGFERLGASARRPEDDAVRGFGMTSWRLMHGALAEDAQHIGR